MSEKNANIKRRAERKASIFLYGEDYGLRFFRFDPEDKDYSEELENFKKLFNSGDRMLRIAAWNSLVLLGEKMPRKEDFSEEEYAFILRHCEAVKKWINVYEANPNSHFSTERLLLRPTGGEREVKLYRKHLREEGDFQLFTGVKLSRNNLLNLLIEKPYCFYVFEKTSGQMVGVVGLHHYDEERRMAEAEWYIFKPYRGKGYGTEAFSALADRAFKGKLAEWRERSWNYLYKKHYAKIDLLRANIRQSNLPSQALAKACGFVHRYTDPRHYVIEGEGLEDGEVYELTPEALLKP